jgi:hypothetical protein
MRSSNFELTSFSSVGGAHGPENDARVHRSNVHPALIADFFAKRGSDSAANSTKDTPAGEVGLGRLSTSGHAVAE